jgi:protein disulfide-isomerase A6
VPLDCDDSNDVCKKYGVEGFPTIKFFKGGKPTDYNGARETEPLVEFAQKESGKGLRLHRARTPFEIISPFYFLHAYPKLMREAAVVAPPTSHL